LVPVRGGVQLNRRLKAERPGAVCPRGNPRAPRARL